MKTYLIQTSGGWRRLVRTRDPFEAMYAIGSAEIVAETTARPAFREMIDTLRWGDLL